METKKDIHTWRKK